MSATMAKEPQKASKRKPPAKEESGIPESGPYQFPLRFADAKVARAVYDDARRQQRSFNRHIVFLLEEAMRAKGRLPAED